MTPSDSTANAFCEPMLGEYIERYPALAGCRDSIAGAAEMLIASVRAGGKILLCGNGGSAADATHIAAELLKSLCNPRRLGAGDVARFTGEPGSAESREGLELAAKLEGAIPAIALTDLGVIHSAFANDVSAEYAFAQLTWALGREGDVLWAISTSGNSRNVIHALRTARARGMKTLGLTGPTGGAMAPLCDLAVLAPGRDTQQIQEHHLPVYHLLCMAMERAVFG